MSADVHDLASYRAPTTAGSPANIEAEQQLLGAILLQHDVLGPVQSILAPVHFSEDIHRRIYDVAVQLAKAGKPVTVASVRTYVGEADLGGTTVPQYLARLAATALPPVLAVATARELRDLAARRDLMAIGEELSQRARHAPPETACAALAAAGIEELQQLAEVAVAADTRREPGACAASMVDRARAISAGEQTDDGVSTGLPDLDRATGGFQPGTLWVVGGRPRMGKTILATGFAKKVAVRGRRDTDEGKAGRGAQLFSLEVAEDQVVARLLADLAYSPRRAISFGQIMQGKVDPSDIWALEEAQKRLAGLPLALDVAASLSVAEIGARVRAEKARMARDGVRLAVVFVDYLKFLRPSDRYRGNRVYEVGEITRGLKEIAKAEGLCVVLLAQVNRGVEGRDRKDRAPGLADLRESGDLEADADVVLFIDRESVRVKQSQEYRDGAAEAIERFLELEHAADLIVAKTRTGSETTVRIWIDAGASTFAAAERGGMA